MLSDEGVEGVDVGTFPVREIPRLWIGKRERLFAGFWRRWRHFRCHRRCRGR